MQDITMPVETQEICNTLIPQLSEEQKNPQDIADLIRAEFNIRGIVYETFDWDNLQPYVTQAGLQLS